MIFKVQPLTSFVLVGQEKLLSRLLSVFACFRRRRFISLNGKSLILTLLSVKTLFRIELEKVSVCIVCREKLTSRPGIRLLRFSLRRLLTRLCKKTVFPDSDNPMTAIFSFLIYLSRFIGNFKAFSAKRCRPVCTEFRNMVKTCKHAILILFNWLAIFPEL